MPTVFVIGAGPAGLFTAQKLALTRHQVVIFNRDIKPGGLAEYGIYPLKDKMKNGLRKQFAKVLALPNIHYFGHVPVGGNSLISIAELREFCPAAMVFAVGAQATKQLSLPGENAHGVYSAKDFVYHYNRLPPFAGQDFSVGKRIAIIGMGNVMVDIARWLLRDDPAHTAEEIIVIARRGPFEAKFDEKEFANIQMYLDRKAFRDELRRVESQITAVGHDVREVSEETFPCLLKYPDQPTASPRLTFRFLSSPFAILQGRNGRIARLILTDNLLVNRNGSVAAESTNATAELDVDTMIFAIGDQHDPCLGLPFGPDGYVTNPDTTNPSAKYEVFDPATKEVLENTYVVGWARKPSEGLVGIARHDGESGGAHVLQRLESREERPTASVDEIKRTLERQGIRIVSKCDLLSLQGAEERQAVLRDLASYKFYDDDAMLSAIEHEKSTSNLSVAMQSAVLVS
ncbi:MAG TPA: FAD-dependent oxidoreductase [Terriglobales bacterium]|jgi:ferredoxin--NADP+ reductase|nr:FAD-dependent oxidoreductase [Terriglobales bacterium]